MKILAIIPARGVSKGFPLKNIRLLNGKPVIYYTIHAASKSKLVNRIVVSTDNRKIAKIVKKIGAEVVNRPKRLAAEKAKIEPVIFHTLEYLKKLDRYKPDIIILLQNTSPLRTSKHVDGAISHFWKGKYDSLLSVSRSHYFLWKKKNKQCRPINYSPTSRPNRQDITNEFVENGAIYISSLNALMKSKCRISGRIGMYVMPEELSYQIDSKLDFQIIKIIMKNNREQK